MRDAPASLRIDKWLWAARFFKTRTLAKEAVEGGKVRLNNVTIKPAREVRPGDELVIQAGEQQFTVIVQACNELRRPASEARLLYTETADSLARREQAQEQRKLAPDPGAEIRGRPSKKAGRLIRRFADG
jgi:ribosome-associated heat shock protein Hsp15